MQNNIIHDINANIDNKKWPILKSRESLFGKSGSESLFKSSLRLLTSLIISIILFLQFSKMKNDKEKYPKMDNFTSLSTTKKDFKYPYTFILVVINTCQLIEELLTFLVEYPYYLCKLKKKILWHNYTTSGLKMIVSTMNVLIIVKFEKPGFLFLTSGIELIIVTSIMVHFLEKVKQLGGFYMTEGMVIAFHQNACLLFFLFKVNKIINTVYFALLPIIIFLIVTIILVLIFIKNFKKKYHSHFFGKEIKIIQI